MDRNAADTCFVPINRWADGMRLAAIIERRRVNLRAWPIKGVTKFKDWALASTLRKEECGEWTFGGIVSVPYETPTTTFLWNPPPVVPTTDDDAEALAERMKGRLIASYSTTKNYPWPNVLKDLKAAVTDDTLIPVRDWVPGENIPSVVRVRTYVSDVAPTRFFLQTDVPKPTEIDGAYNYSRVNFPPCLHGEVVLQNRYLSDARIVDLMPSKRGSRFNGGLVVHQPTNHITWKTHIFDVDVVEDDGLYFRTVSTVEAPKMPLTVLV